MDLHHANIYDSDRLNEPLLAKQQLLPTGSMLPCFCQRWALCHRAWGMLVGLILQLLTFGANFFILTVGGPSLFSESSRQSILILSLLWSAVTTTIAMVVVHRLRAWIYNTEADDLFNLYEDDEEDEEEKGVYNTLVREECHFVEGTTIGVCLAWVIVDANAESTYNVYFSAGTLILALACCRLWLRLCLIQTSTTKHRNQHEVSDMLLLV